jgi:hypothetical protein
MFGINKVYNNLINQKADLKPGAEGRYEKAEEIVNRKKELRLVLVRKWFTAKETIGILYLEDTPLCYILELQEGGKKGQAIPYGVYPIKYSFWAKRGANFPHIYNVPGRSSILIHTGNDRDDTKGCLLPGYQATENKILSSKDAYEDLNTFLKKYIDKKPVFIEVTNATKISLNFVFFLVFVFVIVYLLSNKYKYLQKWNLQKTKF